MRANNIFIAILVAASAAGTIRAERKFYMPMELNSGKVTETVTGNKSIVQTANVAESVPGAKGSGLRLDGYSNYVSVPVNLGNLSQMTFSVWCAMETWPIIEHDVQNESEATCIAGNYDPDAKTGIGFFVTRTGRLSLKFYAGGWPAEIVASKPLPLYQWNNLVAIADGSKITLYNNGVVQGSSNCPSLAMSGIMTIGKGKTDRFFDAFNVMTVNGIVDEIEIYDEALPVSTVRGWKADSEPRLSAVGDGRYADDLWRPAFHGMPSRNWTNETHGLVYYNGQYHLFFQKNANGPYMSRLQWGHLVSDNLYQWDEMPIAIGSDKWYDLKGCWSGCVAVDDVVTAGRPNIIYTGVDYARAMIAQAAPSDNDLLEWTKGSDPIIDGKPAGLSDDFRDPYFFRNGNDAYIIVGTSKDGKGACTLHKFNPSTRLWSNDGDIFFSASSASSEGSFWEMPNITKIGSQHLFTVTPLGMAGGVKAIYRTGTINADGTFKAAKAFASIELPGFAKHGFGLLSPSIMQVGDKTVALGIVPDKLPGSVNYSMGWAHTYSLPREWSIDSDGKLKQKPFEGLREMRVADSHKTVETALNGAEPLFNAPGRQYEIVGEFTVGDADFGYSLFKNGSDEALLYYSTAKRTLTFDVRNLSRTKNDEESFNGLYTTSLPGTIAKGEVLKLHVFVDHSIIDIFINDSWASSVRVFPTDQSADGVEVFSDGGSTAAKVDFWRLDAGQSGIEDIVADKSYGNDNLPVDVYNLSGVCLRSKVSPASATQGLPAGIYFVGNKKVIVR